MTSPPEEHEAPAQAVAEHVAALSADAAALARQEFEAMRQELSASARRAAESGALLAAAGLCGGLALGTSGALVLRVLDSFLPRPVSALVASGALGAAAFVLGGAGLQRTRAALRGPVT